MTTNPGFNMPTAAPSADPGPLNEQHYGEIRNAVFQSRGLRQMISRSRTSAAITLILAAGSTVLALFWPDLTGILIAAGLWIIGAADLWAHRQLLARRPLAATVLAVNQLAMLALVTVYCAWQMLSFSPQTSSQSLDQFSQMLGPGDSAALEEQVTRWTTIGTHGFYGLIILLTLIFQGLRANYYFRKRAELETLNRQTPPWIQRLMDEMRQ